MDVEPAKPCTAAAIAISESRDQADADLAASGGEAFENALAEPGEEIVELGFAGDLASFEVEPEGDDLGVGDGGEGVVESSFGVFFGAGEA